MSPGPAYHAWTHRPKYLGGTDPLEWAAAVHEIKVFEDIVPVVVGDDAFIWEIPFDLDQCLIVRAAAFISTAGSGSTEVQIRLGDAGTGGADILDDKIVIESGEYGSLTATTQPLVFEDTIATWGQHLHIDVDQAGGGAMGLGVHVFYLPYAQAHSYITGAQGPPGGVVGWEGAYDGGATYDEGEAVSSGGSSYVAIQPVPVAIIPGVTPGWEDYWMPLVEGHEPYSGFQVVINGGGYPLDTGVKAPLPIPFDCEIIEGTLLADVAGSCVVDLWSDTYGNYPPTDADSITASAPLTLSAANKTTDTSLTGWTTSLTAGDTISVVIESVSTINTLTVALRVQRP